MSLASCDGVSRLKLKLDNKLAKTCSREYTSKTIAIFCEYKSKQIAKDCTNRNLKQ